MQDSIVWCSAICIVGNEQGLIRSCYQTDCFCSFCLPWVYTRQSLVIFGRYPSSWGCPGPWWYCALWSDSASLLTQQVMVSWLPCKSEGCHEKMGTWLGVEWVNSVSIFNYSISGWDEETDYSLVSLPPSDILLLHMRRISCCFWWHRAYTLVTGGRFIFFLSLY